MCEIELKSDKFAALAKEILSGGHSIRFRAHGFSMRPFIRNGELLEVQALDYRPVVKGDILLYERAGRIIVHRVMRRRARGGEGQLVMQGDALLMPDGMITHQQAWGRVAWVEKRGRQVSTDTWYWRAASWLWMGCAPVRGALFRFAAALKAFSGRLR